MKYDWFTAAKGMAKLADGVIATSATVHEMPGKYK